MDPVENRCRLKLPAIDLLNDHSYVWLIHLRLRLDIADSIVDRYEEFVDDLYRDYCPIGGGCRWLVLAGWMRVAR